MAGRYSKAHFEAAVARIVNEIQRQQAKADPHAFPEQKVDGTCLFCYDRASGAGAYCLSHAELVQTGRGLERR